MLEVRPTLNKKKPPSRKQIRIVVYNMLGQTPTDVQKHLLFDPPTLTHQ